MTPRTCCSNILTTVTVSSPIGMIAIKGCYAGMHSVTRVNKLLPAAPNMDIQCKVTNADSENIPKPLEQCVNWLADYFSMDKENDASPVLDGKHPKICPELGMTEFTWKVYTTLAAQVKFGSRTTYSELAQMIGNPKSVRSVGTALKRNPFSIVIPCHRVLPKSGGIGFYHGGTECAPVKDWLLNYEKSHL